VAWLDPATRAPAGWGRILRSGLVREPLTAIRDADRLPAPAHKIVRGLLNLAAGQVRDARHDLVAAADDPELEPPLAAGARIGAGMAALLAGDAAGGAEIEAGIEAAERCGVPWLARLGRAASRLAVVDDPSRAFELVEAEFDVADDPWGAALADLVRAWAGGDDGADRLAAAERAANGFRRLGAGVLEAWARGLSAVATAELGEPESRESAVAAEGFARATGTPGPRLLAYAALARAEPERAGEHESIVGAAFRETGLQPPSGRISHDVATGNTTNGRHRTLGDEPDRGGAGDGAVIKAFGGFEFRVGGRTVALDGVRPRARTVLRYLALHAGTAVHREVICAAIWPDADPASAARNLHVAMSALRGLLSTVAGGAGAALIVRDGDAYRLAVPPEASDVRSFERAIAAAREQRARGLPAADRLEVALVLHVGPLLPEEGPAEWVVEVRDLYRSQAVEAARGVAEAAVLSGDLDRAIEACRAGLALDRYHDPLWRILINTRDRAGDTGAATRDRREYAALLSDLESTDPAAVSAS
jgi:DNA-binding SARP family transcriptional activator